MAGAAPAAQQLGQRFQQREGAFEVHRFDDAAARAAIEDRVVYGAVVATPQGPHLLAASAASPVVSQLLREPVGARPVASAGRGRFAAALGRALRRQCAGRRGADALSLWSLVGLAAVLLARRAPAAAEPTGPARGPALTG